MAFDITEGIETTITTDEIIKESRYKYSYLAVRNFRRNGFLPPESERNQLRRQAIITKLDVLIAKPLHATEIVTLIIIISAAGYRIRGRAYRDGNGNSRIEKPCYIHRGERTRGRALVLFAVSEDWKISFQRENSRI